MIDIIIKNNEEKIKLGTFYEEIINKNESLEHNILTIPVNISIVFLFI